MARCPGAREKSKTPAGVDGEMPVARVQAYSFHAPPFYITNERRHAMRKKHFDRTFCFRVDENAARLILKACRESGETRGGVFATADYGRVEQVT